MKLYELTSELEQLEVMEIDEQTLNDTFESLSGEFNDKAIAVLKFTENMSSDIDELSAQIERLKKRKSAIENKRDSLRNYLLFNMEKSGITKIECPYFTVSIRRGVESVSIENQDSIPDEFITVIVTEKPDKKALAKDLKLGREIPGVKLVRGNNTLTIK
tara:strand:+ start:32 stop:511 length:480 start_codon:yes stop_codon:yes gene_type:complete